MDHTAAINAIAVVGTVVVVWTVQDYKFWLLLFVALFYFGE